MSGTNLRDLATTIELKSQEICEIILSSAQNGVTELKFGSLHIVFGKKTEPQEISLLPGKVYGASTPDNEISDQTHEQMNIDSLEADELRLRDDQLSQMQIENPLKAEQMLLDQELEDDEQSELDGDESE